MAERDVFGPYLEWAVATKFAYLSGEWFPVLLEVEQSAAGFVSRDFHPELIRVPWIYQAPPRDEFDAKVTFWMAIMNRSALYALVEGKGAEGIDEKLNPLIKWIKRLELGSPVVPHFPAPKPLSTRLKSLSTSPPRTAIVAVIDDGLAFAHERFRFATGATRFKYFWNQDDPTLDRAPPDLGWGRELLESELNALLMSCNHSGLVDEDELYRKAGQNLVARRAKHGTHVMDIACGLDPQDASDSSPYLIGVQLPHWVTTETSGGLLTPMVYAALTYILSRADQIAVDENTAPLPVVVNLSYGTIAGPHDGTTPLELAIDQLIAARPTPLRVVLPAGNHYLARCHTHFKMAKASARRTSIESLQWRVQPDGQSAAFMEIWLPDSVAKQAHPQVAVRITAPTGVTSPWIEPGGVWSLPTLSGIGVGFRAHYVDSAAERPWILLAMAPTAHVVTDPLTAPSGTWLVELKNTGRAIAVDAWVQRGDTPFGYPLRGRQSRFVDTKYDRFDLAGRLEENDNLATPIRRRGTVNALATERHAIVIGGFRRSDYHPSNYSGAGPIATRPDISPWHSGPDAAAAADDSVALHGVLAAGTRTGSVVAMNGTSVAAPHVTRLISKWMTMGLASDRAAVRAFAAAHDPHPPPHGSMLEERIGAGRIEGHEKLRWKRW
jgi:hypothetical protein